MRQGHVRTGGDDSRCFTCLCVEKFEQPVPENETPIGRATRRGVQRVQIAAFMESLGVMPQTWQVDAIQKIIEGDMPRAE